MILNVIFIIFYLKVNKYNKINLKIADKNIKCKSY